jgi:hypothetical protein
VEARRGDAGTKKLQMPRLIRTTANINPCAVLRSSVGNISPLQSWKNGCCAKPPPMPSRIT